MSRARLETKKVSWEISSRILFATAICFEFPFNRSRCVLPPELDYWKDFTDQHMSKESETEAEGEGSSRYTLLTGDQKVGEQVA